MDNQNSVFMIGIAGGTGSGKTTIAKDLQKASPQQILLLSHDNYFKDRSDYPLEERKKLNYDEPAAIDNDLFYAHLTALSRGESVDMPVYDFATHTRKPETIRISPAPIIIVEGILIFTDPRVLELLDLSIFVEVDADIRLARRLLRDVGERDRTFEESINQYLTSAQDMHDKHVEPGNEEADLVINNDKEWEDLEAALTTVKARIDEVLGKC